MYSKRTKIVNQSGLHARPASDLTLKAKQFSSSITILNCESDKPAFNAKSIVKLLAASIKKDNEIEISAEGEDEEQAVDALIALVELGFGE